jgi:hypothetical protein
VHKNIKRFELCGTIGDDADFIRLRLEHSGNLIAIMRDQGYVPRFDIEECWSTEWNGTGYDFKLSVYGVFVGKRKVNEEWIAGYDGNRVILCTPPVKSVKPSGPQGSESTVR